MIVAGVVTVVMYIYFKYSKQGYEISVVGESENTARYVGHQSRKGHYPYHADFRRYLRYWQALLFVGGIKPYDYYHA